MKSFSALNLPVTTLQQYMAGFMAGTKSISFFAAASVMIFAPIILTIRRMLNSDVIP